uniref:Uncharacterized protein n=1 Tax=Alexandrium catenella TaxID=2925 RepID=A0A7S1PQX5_ALECA|mmetsp:Transcript_10637/g.28901  ORF Transcript_10637/g.28901 Transcript_10637/m.28901 type:complete len:206 (+) Transcript_10637:3-620(+)
MASLRHEKGALEGKVAALKDQLKQPCQGGLRAKRTQLAQQKDELSGFDAQIAACAQKRGEVEQTLATAQERFDSLKALSRYGLSMEEQDLAQAAEALSEEAYGRFQCFADSEHFVEPEQPPSSTSEDLSKLPANLLEVFQNMLKEQRELFLLQLKADKERGKAAAGSVCGSDAGESYTLLPDNVGAAERFAIFSGASSARSSGEP